MPSHFDQNVISQYLAAMGYCKLSTYFTLSYDKIQFIQNVSVMQLTEDENI